jgi:NitT/TauT family transport system ATP-binding protein
MSAVAPSTAADISFENVSKSFVQHGRTIRALDDCSLLIRPGEIFSLVGPSGTGKTTLLNLVAGFDIADTGDMRVGGRTVDKPGPDRAVVFQAPTLMPWLTARDNVAMGLWKSGIPRAERRRIAEDQLAELGLADGASRRPYQMSGGMQQRVGIARALAMKPSVLLMDEPFAALDSYVRSEMQQLVVSLHAKHPVTTLFVTHSIEEALLISDRVGVMAAGAIGNIYEVGFDQPRDPTTEEFNLLRHEIAEQIEVGVHTDRESRR